MVRKFAFHMILAGHRFSKAGQVKPSSCRRLFLRPAGAHPLSLLFLADVWLQRKHALRCYAQAMQVYKDRDWSLAEDHINFTIGRQSFTLGQLDNAVTAFKQILVNDSRQLAGQQVAFLREYLYVHKVTRN